MSKQNKTTLTFIHVIFCILISTSYTLNISLFFLPFFTCLSVSQGEMVKVFARLFASCFFADFFITIKKGASTKKLFTSCIFFLSPRYYV